MNNIVSILGDKVYQVMTKNKKNGAKMNDLVKEITTEERYWDLAERMRVIPQPLSEDADPEDIKRRKKKIQTYKNRMKKLAKGSDAYEYFVRRMIYARGLEKEYYWVVEDLLNSYTKDLKQKLGILARSSSKDGSKSPLNERKAELKAMQKQTKKRSRSAKRV